MSGVGLELSGCEVEVQSKPVPGQRHAVGCLEENPAWFLIRPGDQEPPGRSLHTLHHMHTRQPMAKESLFCTMSGYHCCVCGLPSIYLFIYVLLYLFFYISLF